MSFAIKVRKSESIYIFRGHGLSMGGGGVPHQPQISFKSFPRDPPTDPVGSWPNINSVTCVSYY